MEERQEMKVRCRKDLKRRGRRGKVERYGTMGEERGRRTDGANGDN
jgi:hypothetical protein